MHQIIKYFISINFKLTKCVKYDSRFCNRNFARIKLYNYTYIVRLSNKNAKYKVINKITFLA